MNSKKYSRIFTLIDKGTITELNEKYKKYLFIRLKDKIQSKVNIVIVLEH